MISLLPLNEHARYKRGVGRHENGARKINSHGKWWSCVVSRFPLCYMPNMGGCECLQVGIVSTKFPEHVYDFASVKMATLRSGRVRLSFSIDFDNYASKSAFGNRLEYIRSLLTPTGQRNLDNHGLMNAMFDLVERAIPRSFPGSSQAPSSTVQSFNADAGK